MVLLLVLACLLRLTTKKVVIFFEEKSAPHTEKILAMPVPMNLSSPGKKSCVHPRLWSFVVMLLTSCIVESKYLNTCVYNDALIWPVTTGRVCHHSRRAQLRPVINRRWGEKNQLLCSLIMPFAQSYRLVLVV